MKRFRRMDTINIVPFIDIMLVLLVIVLTSATFIAQGKIPIAIPQAQGSQEISKSKKSIEITIDAQGNYYFDGKEMDLEGVKIELSKLPKETSILLRGDQKSYFEQFVKLIGILNQTGHSNVDVEVERK
ncbi:TonB system transport protein ExbD [Helicobacter turcicus]|uniref:Biopolymer transport protein ExbD n=1 Tax=Helicobacter turcicus TaxID=2867412 RepID=A0ABS7JKV9_9HELI|nr:TonB system transport protein ExbD [Helicobacter turcicus]MBX7490033.1 TonB system transport protein ExbD [Helicobacter turcicus]MBX7544892.1 TonB system transport protein ExbD [Helicobacter turcicus]